MWPRKEASSMSKNSGSALDRAREAFENRVWERACLFFGQAEQAAPLEPDDLEAYARSAYLAGKDSLSTELFARCHKMYLDSGAVDKAVRAAFWLAMQLVDAGDMAQAGGWLSRAHRLLEERHLDCVEQGYLIIPAALQSLESGDAAAANATFGQAEKIGQRFGDRDLVVLARLGRGLALNHLGEVSEGLALFDEIMVAVTSGEVSAIPAGIVYCAVIEACIEVFDYQRAREWTEALSRWCESQPDLVAYRGQCLARRAEVMQMRGEWDAAAGEAQRALELLAGRPAVGIARYVQAELHRLRGEFSAAEEGYREAHAQGRTPHPGLSRLRLAQGRVSVACSSLKSAMQEAQGRAVERSKVLAAYVEATLAAGDVDAARAAADELAALAAEWDAAPLTAMAKGAEGSVLRAEGQANAALGSLRESWRLWRQMDAPYEAARVQEQMGLACRELGDDEGAQLELDAARTTFQRLRALPDLARIEALMGRIPPISAGGLTDREMQVLRLVAAGKTNRAIAEELFLSEKTVARHLSNIFTKLGVTSRAAATSYAYEHDLVH